MAYLGNDLQVAFPVYRNIDDISGSFNSSATSFPLTVNGVAPVPAPLYSQQCLISVGGVVQRPDDSGSEGFRLSGSNIVFASAPTTGADFFGVILAGADYVDAGGNFPSGTASVPSITFNDDLDTGIFNSGANQISFATGGSERLRIDSAGQIESVSLGTAAAPAFSFTTDPNTGFYSPGADQLAISTNGTGRVFIDSSGRLLVGTTTSNGAQLEVNRPQSVATGLSAVLSSPQFSITNSSNWGFPVGAVFKTPLANGGAIVDNAAIWAEFESTNNAYLGFATRSSGTVAERMRITNAGRVGIGTTNPGTAKLDVIGDSLSSYRGLYAFGGDQTNAKESNIIDGYQWNTGNSTAFADQRSSLVIRAIANQSSNNELANNALLLLGANGASVNPGDLMKGYHYGGTSYVFRMAYNGNITNLNNSYGSLSDERLKQDISDAGSAWDDVKLFRVRKFRFKSDVELAADRPNLGEAPYLLGVIAQEIEQVSPGLIDCAKLEDGSPDPDATKQVKYSVLYMKAVKALQEAMERIETLEAKVAALESA